MNVKELLLVVFLALITTWGIDYLFFNKSKTNQEADIRSGQSFVAPKNTHKIEPLKTEVDFIEMPRTLPVITTIDTDYAQYQFSTEGASLERLEFKAYPYYGLNHAMTTITSDSAAEREKRCFLVALNEQTPYQYTLINKHDTGKEVYLTYQAETPSCTLGKKFRISKTECRIDLEVTLKPKNNSTQQARIMFPAPLLSNAADDTTSALISDEHGAITLIARKNINSDTYWFAPFIFGADDRYFVNAIIADPAHFTQRAYYLLTGQKNITAIAEGPAVKQDTSWSISFYCGPKNDRAMVAVDPRLHQTLGYAGWFAPIAKWLLDLLNFLYRYVGNYGLAIIVLTILTKLLLLPFSLKGAQSMKKQNEVQRKLKYLQQKYKDDVETLTRERAELMRKEGLSSMAGCLPLLLQLPIFFALSRVLSTALELYQAPFLWISDLSAVDPYYILPLLTAITMVVQATTVDPKQRVQLLIMALIFGALTASLASGLVLYIFMSTVLGIIQTVVQQKLKLA